MDPEEQARQASARRDALIREMERKSLDTIMVYNPTEKDYMIEWDQRYHRVPAKNKNMGFGNGRMELPRYLAEKYAREMKNHIINTLADSYMADLRRKREISGHPFRDKFEENNDALPLVPKTNDLERVREIYKTLILGVVREWAMEQPENQSGEAYDTKTPEEQVLESMNAPYVPSVDETESAFDNTKPLEASTGVPSSTLSTLELSKPVAKTTKKHVAEEVAR
jgi:hypothetical protein